MQQLAEREVMLYERENLKESVNAIRLNTRIPLDKLDVTFFNDYHLFPQNILTHYSQWHQEGRSMLVGDTIVQQIYLPPIRRFSLKLVVGVRIKEVINESHRRGYSYETLEGHVEKGISIFTLEQSKSGMIFKIHTYSKPGNELSELAAPFFSNPYQKFCTRQALANVKRQIS